MKQLYRKPAKPPACEACNRQGFINIENWIESDKFEVSLTVCDICQGTGKVQRSGGKKIYQES